MGVQTGGGGVGAAAAIFAAKPTYTGGQYFGMKITASAGANVAGMNVNLNWAGTTDL
jgi:hypothetical protein